MSRAVSEICEKTYFFLSSFFSIYSGVVRFFFIIEYWNFTIYVYIVDGKSNDRKAKGDKNYVKKSEAAARIYFRI